MEPGTERTTEPLGLYNTVAAKGLGIPLKAYIKTATTRGHHLLSNTQGNRLPEPAHLPTLLFWTEQKKTQTSQ